MSTLAPPRSRQGSALYVGTLLHTRFVPVHHAFRYPVAFAVIDVDELPALDRATRLFGYNRRRPFAIRDRDYLGRRDRSIGDNIRQWLADQGVELDPAGQIRLITNLRTVGYVFNPVSFFHCTDAGGRLVCAVAEVSNTFGERRPYLLDDRNLVATGANGRRTWSQTKELHVSPFFGMGQRYEFTLSDLGARAIAKVDLFEDGRRVLTAAQVGERRPFDDATLARLALRHPLMGQQVTGLIHLEALKLWRKGVPFHRKPRFAVDTGSQHDPTPHAVTTALTAPTADRVGLRPPPPPPPSWIPVGLMRRAFDWALSRPVGGVIELTTPDMASRTLGDPSAPRRARITVNSRDLYRRLITRRRVAIGESYVAGDWDADDLVAALEILLLTGEDLRRRPPGAWITRALELRPHRPRANPPAPARRDIAYHYDLGNAVYEAFLDPTLSYSCAIFTHPDQSLEDAQRAKHRSVCDKLRLGPDDHLLEIGCGWGGFALTAAHEYGARVTGVTISQEQYDTAVARVRDAGLSDRVTILLQDYRTLQGEFSKIASIEMFEAIGEAEYVRFFATCDRLLTPNGIACVQTIAMPDHRYERYRRTTDWLKEYIFPGSLIPSLAAITAALARSQLIVHGVEDIGIHYARTLRMWSEAFERNIGEVAGLGQDPVFLRTWRFYLAACEAAFRTRAIHDYQLVLTRPFNDALGDPAAA